MLLCLNFFGVEKDEVGLSRAFMVVVILVVPWNQEMARLEFPEINYQKEIKKKKDFLDIECGLVVDVLGCLFV